MKIYTIGFTKIGAEEFFRRLREAGVERVVDVRLNNTSQLAGFAKKDDLAFFLDAVLGVAYEHEPVLTPTEAILRAYRADKKKQWPQFEKKFNALIAKRGIENALKQKDFRTPTALLCGEHTPDHCHRRLIAEYLAGRWRGVEVVHL